MSGEGRSWYEGNELQGKVIGIKQIKSVSEMIFTRNTSVL